MSGSPSTDALEARALAGDRRALGRLLTLLDDGGDDAVASAQRMAERAGRAWVVGITGVPGSGKSTLVDALLGAWLGDGAKVAVIAIDPSSPVSGGAVLGDRIRMGANAAHADVFIRSFSARGELGGLSRATLAAVDCFDACGFDRIVVETVGTGQSETAIVALADTRVVVCPPGLGDAVQAIKAGTLEIADILAISKGDLPLAAQTAGEMREMLTLRHKPAAGAWVPRVVVVSAISGAGIADLLGALDLHRQAHGTGRRNAQRAVAAAPAHAPRATSAESSFGGLDGAGWLARLAGLAARDGLCAALAITVVSGGPGRAEVTMTVDARHLNFNGGGHGGAIFSLADSAFGLASNSHGPVASGIDAHITFQAAVRAGDRLVARAVEVTRSRRIAVYRIEVVRPEADGAETPVSTFTGTVYIKS
ncbi:MAG: methylmalonyl Co-A mutase-associated GTPase MeaB [Caldimonas sp.]